VEPGVIERESAQRTVARLEPGVMERESAQRRAKNAEAQRKRRVDRIRAEEENDRRCARRKIPGVIGVIQHYERWRDWNPV
jgi:hypothetical protein